MLNSIKRPTDPYDPLWALFNQHNPGMLRSVGADAAGGADPTPPSPAPASPAGADPTPPASGGGDPDPTPDPTPPKDTPAPAAADTDWSAGIEDKDVLKLANRYTSRADQATAHFELTKEMGGRIKVPGKDASEEDVAKFHKSLGVPDKADGYTFNKPEHMPDEMFKSEGVQGTLNDFKATLHTAGATPAVATAVMNHYWKAVADAEAAIAKNDDKVIKLSEAALRKEWGKDYEQNVRFGEAFLEKQGASNLKQMELKDGSLLGSHPDFLKMTAVSGRRIGEGSLQIGLNGTEAGVDYKKESTRLAVAVAEANAKGDTDLAEKLAVERRAVNEKLYGADAA